MIRSAAIASLMVALVGAIDCLAGQSMREEIEADWQKQDAARMRQICEPGTIRYPGGLLQWPGAKPDVRWRIPRIEGAKLDGRLDEPCWARAAVLAGGSQTEPAVRLAHDGQRLWLGVSFPTTTETYYTGSSTAADAAGGVDGVKDGRYGFHVGWQANPWWQVDLGHEQAIARVVVYNRLDYAPGLHNADKLQVLTSNDGRKWTLRHDNKGVHFGGMDQAGPLVVKLTDVSARYVRLALPSDAPLFFHLDEIEVFGPREPGKNLALHRPARQSSLSPWSRGGEQGGCLCNLAGTKIWLDGTSPSGVSTTGGPLEAESGRTVRREGQTTVEVVLPLASFAGGFPADARLSGGKQVPLARGGNWRIDWPARWQFGAGKNRMVLGLEATEPLAEPVQLRIESIVFTPQGPKRRFVFQKQLEEAGPVDVEFTIAQEGAAALVVDATQGEVNFHEGRTVFIEPIAEKLNRIRCLVSEFGVAEPPALEVLEKRASALAAYERADGPDQPARHALYQEVRWLAREVAFQNPLLGFRELLFVKRYTQQSYPDVCLNHMPWVSRPGGDLCILKLPRFDERPEVRAIVRGQLGPGHVHGMDLHWDGKRIVFGYAKAKSDRPPAGWLDRATNFRLRREEEPTHLFEIGTDGTGLRQVTDGQWSDLDPTYTPSGDIVFVSERCGCSLQCNEYDKDETSCNLFVCRPDGSNIRHMSISKDGDYLPHTLDSGLVAYTRWEYQEREWANIQSIWTIRPDGTGADAVFKQHFNDPWALEDVRSIPDSQRLACVAAGHHTLAAGPVVEVDLRRGINNPDGIEIVTPGVLPPEGGMSGRVVREGGVLGTGGYYMTPWPLSERYFLVSATYNGEYRAGGETDEKGYALYLIDVYGNKELLYRDPEISCSIPVPLRPRRIPPIYRDMTDPTKDYAVCTISDITRGVPGIQPGEIRYLRIGQRIQWPYDNTHGGQRYEPDAKGSLNWTPARVIGTVPVEADGSATFRVPANTAVYFQLLDANQMELRRMRSFISFQPGEVRGCVGCHETRAESAAPKQFPLALVRDPAIPTPPPWGTRAMSFLRDVQPVLDRQCAGCHQGLKPSAGVDLSGGLTAEHNRAYDTITARGLVARSNVHEDSRITQPLAFGSHRSKLIAVLTDPVHAKAVRLSDDEWLRLVTWIDLNAFYHDGFLNKRLDPMPYNLGDDQALRGRILAVHARRCGGCHKPEEVTRLDWIDLYWPEKSPMLAGPLAAAAGGRGACRPAPYAQRTDEDYQAVLRLIEGAVAEAWTRPRRDLRTLPRLERVAGHSTF